MATEIEDDIYREYHRACTKHPDWPTDIIHQTSIMVEEAGETMQAALNHYYHGGSIEEVRKEAI